MVPLNHSHIDLEAANDSIGGGGGDSHLNTSSLQVSAGDVVEQSIGPQILEVVVKKSVSLSTTCSECSVVVVQVVEDLEDSSSIKKPHLFKNETDCRICQLSLDASNHESGIPIQLGCSCKDDLAAAHKQCAEAWFKIKGDIICEICGSTALNVEIASGGNEVAVVEQSNEHQAGIVAAPGPSQPECRKFWQGHRFLNFMLACVVFAFVISWLFHFNVPSS